MIAESDGDFIRAFFACQYAGLVPAPMPLPVAFGGRGAYIEHVRRMILSAKASAMFTPAVVEEWIGEAAQGLNLIYCGTARSEEHTSELQSLMRISYDFF